MTALVRIALRRPYTFVVLALLLLIIGPLAAWRTPVDIFPEIRIPVIAAIWRYTGLPPAEMAGRMVTQFERALTTTVNDIEHIEANSYNGVGIVKIFFQQGADIRTANAQVTAISQTLLKQMPPGAVPPLILNYNASTVPIIQLALSGKGLPEQTLFDLGLNFVRVPIVTVPGAAMPYPFGGKFRQIQIDVDPAAMRARGLSGQDVANALAAQNLITPVGTEKIGSYEYTINLNDAPSAIQALDDLPIKTVNGAMVYIHDIGHVRDGSPPQQNIVHVDGNRSVLMFVLKNGAVSTLAIIDGVKKKVEEMKKTLPSNLVLTAIGDQSIFINAAIGGVIREGVIAAALTSLMILLFLGSFRSTLIIAVSIPLSVLGSIATLWALGETLNIMTLGGLALAVGILVDEATVTIENINWHLEQGKEVEQAILDGAEQIVTPAFVSLLCICIVFVPMFFLTGVPRFLFVPLAEAVISAMVWSFILSRTLVPTMAKYMLRKHVAHGAHADGADAPPPRSRNPLVRFQRGFESRFERGRLAYREVLTMALRHRAVFVTLFLAFIVGSFALTPYLGRDFFPSVDGGRILMHVRAHVGTRVEESARLFADIEKVVRQTIPPDQLETLVDNIGFPVSGINMTYNNTGTIGSQDGEIQIGLTEDHRPTAEYVKALREELPAKFPGVTFSFLPADIISQNSEFRRPGADRGPDPRAETRREFRLCAISAAAAAARPRAGRCAHPAIAQRAGLQCRRRPHPRAICRHYRTRRHQQPGRGSGRIGPGAADLLAQSRERGQLFDRHADAAISDQFAERAAEPADHRAGRAVASPRRHRRHQARGGARGLFALQYPAGDPDLRHHAGPRSRRGCRRRTADHQQHRGRRAEDRRRDHARAGQNHEQLVQRAVLRPRRRHRAHLSPDRRQLPILGRSVRHHHRAAGGAGRYRLGAVRHRNDAVGAGADRRHHVHGRRHRQQRPGHQLRQGEA